MNLRKFISTARYVVGRAAEMGAAVIAGRAPR